MFRDFSQKSDLLERHTPVLPYTASTPPPPPRSAAPSTAASPGRGQPSPFRTTFTSTLDEHSAGASTAVSTGRRQPQPEPTPAASALAVVSLSHGQLVRG